MNDRIQTLATGGRKLFAYLGFAGAALTLSACATSEYSRLDSPLYAPPAGSVVSLKKDLEIDKERSRVYIQDGKIYSSIKGIEQYAPWCAVEAHRGGSAFGQPFAVRSGRFDVVRSWKGIDYASLQELDGPYRVAAKTNDNSERPLIWVSPRDEDRPMETLATYMQISSVDQPAVKVLVCGVFADSVVYNHLRVSQIQSTLGDVISLSLPPK